MRFRTLWVTVLGYGMIYSQAGMGQEAVLSPAAPIPVEPTTTTTAETAAVSAEPTANLDTIPAVAAPVPAGQPTNSEKTIPATPSPAYSKVNEEGPASGIPANPAEPSRLGIAPGQHLPAPAEPLTNQQMANAIAQQLRQSGLLRHYQLDIVFQQGVAELSGQVANAGQRDEVIRIVQSVPGVAKVRDRLSVGHAALVMPTQAVNPEPSVEAAPLPNRAPDQAVNPKSGTAGSSGGLPPEPTPIFQAPSGNMGMAPVPDPFMQPPRMPPYAWPSYAPYNNLSRVAYPTTYPYEAWPFIGPMYPYPKIPPGWRSVTLEWKDGSWWYGRNATGHDWWRIRYW